MNSTRIREEHEVGVRIHYADLLNVVLLLRLHTDDTAAASALCGVYIGRLALDVAAVRERDNSVVTLDEVLKKDLVFGFLDARAALVTEAALDLEHFFLDYSADLRFIRENTLVFRDRRVEVT